jgi:hypothetical protein
MGLVKADEEVYQLELQVYQTISPNFKYKFFFLSMEIGTNTRTTSATSSIFWLNLKEQLVTTKSINPIRRGTSLDIIPLPMIILTIPIEFIPKPIDAPSLLVNNKLETLKILITTIPLTPPQIGVGLDITLISNTPHASEVFIMPITSFEETLDQH